MASLFDKLLEEFWQESQRHIESLHEKDSRLPERTWAGWESLASQLGVQGDSPAFRVRQAVKLVLAADNLNLQGKHVDWSALERQLEAITAGFLGLSQLPTTEEDLERQAGPRATILWDQAQKAGRKGRKIHSYWVVLEGQEEKDGEWFTNAELKRHFPDSYQAMKNEFRAARSQRQHEGQAGRLHDPEGQGGQAAVGTLGAAPGGTTSMPPADLRLGGRSSPQGNLGQQWLGQNQHLADSSLGSRGGQNGGSRGWLGEQRAQEPALSSARQRAGRASASPIPGASCVPRKKQPSPPRLFSDSGPPASMMLAGISPTNKASPTAAATAQPVRRQRPAQNPTSAPAQQTEPARAALREQHYVLPPVVTLAQLAAALEPANQSRMQDSSPMLRKTRIAAPMAPIQPAVANAGTLDAGTAGPASDGMGPGEQQRPVGPGTTSPKRRQEVVTALTVPAHASLLPGKPGAAALHPLLSPQQQQRPEQPGQRQPAHAAPSVLASPPGPSRLAAQMAKVSSPLADVDRNGAAAPSAGQDAGYPRRSPEVDFSGVHPLLRRNAEYVYRTTGRLPPGAVFVAPQQLRQSPAQAGLDALLQVVPKPRGSVSAGQPSRQSPAVVAAAAAAPHSAAAAPSAAALPLQQTLLSSPTARRHSAASAGRAGQPSSAQLECALEGAQREQHQKHEQQQRGSLDGHQLERDLSLAVPPSSLPTGERQQQQQHEEKAGHHDLPLVQDRSADEPERHPVHLPGQAHEAAAVSADSWQCAQPPSTAEQQAMVFMRRFPDKAPTPVFPPAVLAMAAHHRGPGVTSQSQLQWRQQQQQQPRQSLDLSGVQTDVPRSSAHNVMAGDEELHDAGGEQPRSAQPQPQQPSPWLPLDYDTLRTQPDEVQWTAADAAGLGRLELTQQQQHTPWAPLTQQLGDALEGHGAPSQQLVVPDTEEQEQPRAAHKAARALEQPPGAADMKPPEPGGAELQIKEELEERDESEEVVAVAEPDDMQIPSLDELLGPEAWATATIRGAKNRDDGVHLAVEWTWSDGGQHKQALPSSLLMGRPHCMETLIRFYESKATTGGRRKRAGDGEAGGSESNGPNQKRRRKEG
ncbi:hypothetical protein N2152v2_009414 [Parachlorella kessleri]